MTVRKLDKNKAGKRFAIQTNRDPFDGSRREGFNVLVECSNYSRGRIVKTWRTCAVGVPLEEAETIFARKLKTKSK